jgi:GNAT superfamily N-acetyltransferase
MEKKVTLKDGREILIRDMRPEDHDRSMAFFSDLPADDRKYLRRDVTRSGVVERRIKEIATGRVLRLVAIDGDEVVADGALELAGHGWGDKIAEFRLIVARPYQRKGLGTLLAREIYALASQRPIDRIVARIMRPQKGAHSILQKLGFHDEFLIPEHVRDASGQWQDMIIMRCNLQDLWKEMEHLISDSDWRRHR